MERRKMTDHGGRDESSADEEATARLLRIAESRPDAPADRAARVREVVQVEWRAAARRRRLRRRVAAGVALVAAAVVVIVVRLSPVRRAVPAGPPERIASVERVEGHVVRAAEGRSRELSSAGVRLDSRIMPGDVIETGGGSRAALRLSTGASLRLDAASHVRLLSASIVELAAGAVYVDSGTDAAARGMEIRTPLGIARDVGTQFEVRIQGTSLRLMVRSGLVEVHQGARVVRTPERTELVMAAGAPTNRPILPYGPDWDWAAILGPDFAIEGRTLGAFLTHISRERGWSVHYVDQDLARRASTIMLHGSIEGLEPAEALDIALATSGLEYRLVGGDLTIYPPAPSNRSQHP